MKRVYKCEYCYLQNAKPCYECSACMSGDDHFRPAKPEKKQMTNADRIRAMNDGELAEFIKNIKVRAALCKSVKNNDAFEELCSAEWLQQPVKEND